MDTAHKPKRKNKNYSWLTIGKEKCIIILLLNYIYPLKAGDNYYERLLSTAACRKRIETNKTNITTAKAFRIRNHIL